MRLIVPEKENFPIFPASEEDNNINHRQDSWTIKEEGKELIYFCYLGKNHAPHHLDANESHPSRQHRSLYTFFMLNVRIMSMNTFQIMHLRPTLLVLIAVCTLQRAIGEGVASKDVLLNRTLEYLKVTSAEESYDAVIKMTMNSLAPLLGSQQAEFKRLINQCCSFSSVKQDLAQLYAEEFTLKDMNQLIRFYSSPIGKKYVKKQPVLLQKAQALGQRKVNEHLAKFTALLQSSLHDD